jgi:predicted nucleic acid-binding protein
VSINDAFSHDCIILDACCLINLFASRQMRAVLETIPKSLSVATYVRDHEVLSIYSGPTNNVQETSELIDLQPFIDDRLLLLVDIETEVEENTYINFAEKLDDGEAITGAIALNRNWAIATDDSASVRLFQNSAPHIALVSTLDLVKYWADTIKPVDDIIREAILNIRVRGKYEPHRTHPLYAWWQKFIR